MTSNADSHQSRSWCSLLSMQCRPQAPEIPANTLRLPLPYQYTHFDHLSTAHTSTLPQQTSHTSPHQNPHTDYPWNPNIANNPPAQQSTHHPHNSPKHTSATPLCRSTHTPHHHSIVRTFSALPSQAPSYLLYSNKLEDKLTKWLSSFIFSCD